MIATRTPRDGAPTAHQHPTAASPLPAGIPPLPAEPAPRSVVATPVAPFTLRERIVLTAWAAVGSCVLRLAEAVAPEPHHPLN